MKTKSNMTVKEKKITNFINSLTAKDYAMILLGSLIMVVIDFVFKFSLALVDIISQIL